jgi:hypothetical protein
MNRVILETEDLQRALRANLQQIGSGKRLLMLLINYLPFLQAISIGLTVCIPWSRLPVRVVSGLGLLYLAPPLAARLLRFVIPVREGRMAFGKPGFFAWWALFNLQVVFSRFPALEEALRMVPGLYSLWLRLWGARIGRLTYWAAGTKILDRSFVQIGDDVMFGAAVRINPHVIARNEESKELELILATVVIGDRAVIGGYSLLTAGTEIAADECTRAFLVSPPFGKWKNGTRVAKSASPR